MKAKTPAVVALLWLLSLALTAGVAWRLAGLKPTRLADTPRLSDTVPEAPIDAERARLTRELEATYDRLASALRAYKTLLEDRLNPPRAVLKAPARTEKPSETRDVEAIWRTKLARIGESRKKGMLGGIDPAIMLTTAFAAMGEEGVSFLIRVVNDEQRPVKERETALEILSYQPYPSALKALIHVRSPDLTERNVPYDLIVRQIAALSTNSIQEVMPELVNRIALDLGKNDAGPERSEVLAYLALTHHDPAALSLLSSNQMWNENIARALDIAAGIHSPDARTFVHNMARYHRNPVHRQKAAQLFAAWKEQ